MHRLENRLSRLERTASPADSLCVIVRRFVGASNGHPDDLAPLYGYGMKGTNQARTIRHPGETDEELEERAETAARRNSAPGCVILLEELRGDAA